MIVKIPALAEAMAARILCINAIQHWQWQKPQFTCLRDDLGHLACQVLCRE
jgi:hypothetical protein